MIEVNFYDYNNATDRIATVLMWQRVKIGDTIMINDVLYEVIHADTLSITYNKEFNKSNIEQTAKIKMIF